MADIACLFAYPTIIPFSSIPLGAVSARILEINPTHPLIKDLAARAKADATAPALHDAALLLLDQARILEGEPLPDPAGFARRMSQVMAQGISG